MQVAFASPDRIFMQEVNPMPTTVAASTEIETLEEARERLGLGWAEISAIVGVNESTIHRWRSGASAPRPMARSRITQVQELLDLLRRLFAGPDLARQWLANKRPKSLGGNATPLSVMLNGRIDRVLTLLHFLARGA